MLGIIMANNIPETESAPQLPSSTRVELTIGSDSRTNVKLSVAPAQRSQGESGEQLVYLAYYLKGDQIQRASSVVYLHNAGTCCGSCQPEIYTNFQGNCEVEDASTESTAYIFNVIVRDPSDDVELAYAPSGAHLSLSNDGSGWWTLIVVLIVASLVLLGSLGFLLLRYVRKVSSEIDFVPGDFELPVIEAIAPSSAANSKSGSAAYSPLSHLDDDDDHDKKEFL